VGSNAVDAIVVEGLHERYGDVQALAHLFALSVVTAAFARWTFRVYMRAL
jgi:hypothetical protein